jgi:uncharacterized protein
MTILLLWILAALLVLLGVFGTIVPALPGAPLVFGGLVLAAWIDSFTKVGWNGLFIIGILMAIALSVDLIATSIGAKKAGASPLAVTGAALGTLVGVFFALPGIILGPFVGAFAGEYYVRRDVAQANKVGISTWLGLMIGTVIKLVLLFWMVGVFVLFYLF